MIYRALLAFIFLLGILLHIPASADWAKEWEKALEGAKKEGQVSIYLCSTCSATNRYEAILDEFKKEYREIKVVTVTGSGAQLVQREIAERRAGKYLADIHSGGANAVFNTLYKGKALDPIKPALILPEVVDEPKWYGKKHNYIDPEDKYIFAYLASVSTAQLFYNSSIINPKDFKSYRDLLIDEHKI